VNVSGATLLRVFSLFPDPHMFSFYMGLILPILISFVLFYDRDCDDSGSLILRSKIIGGVFVFIMFLSEALTFSRGGYIGMVAGLGTLIILGWSYFGGKKKFVIGSFFAVFIFFAATNGQSFVTRFVSSFDLSEGSNSERRKNWGQGYEMFSDNFFSGVGIGNYSYEIKPSADYRTPIYAHNTYLDIGAEMGIFALLAWIVLFGASIFGLYRSGKYADSTSERAFSFGLIASLVWFSVHGFFDTAIYSPTVLAVLMVILAMTAIKVQNVSIPYLLAGRKK
jgi:O-antigen ligase